MLAELSERIWSHEEFHVEYTGVLSNGLLHSLPSNTASLTPPNELVTRRLLQSAAVLAGSPLHEHRDAAYRIATTLLRFHDGELDGLANVATIILGRLSNFATLRTLLKDVENHTLKVAPDPLWFELQSHELRNTIKIGPKLTYALTGFQKEVWDALNSGESVSISGPTSCGKSFITQAYLLGRASSNPQFSSIYIVPSRALISQVATDLRYTAKAAGITDIAIYTIPQPPTNDNEPVIYVLTQERLQLLRSNFPEVSSPHVVIVDEAHSIAEGDRGTLLETVLQDIASHDITKEVATQFIFGAPLTKNLVIYKPLLKLQQLQQIRSLESPVAQNILRVDVNKKEINLSLWADKRLLPLHSIEADISHYTSHERLAWASAVLGAHQQSLVYVGGQSRAEKVAKDISTRIDQPSDNHQLELADLAQFVRDYIHPNYSIVNCIPKGVAYHYGNMPAILRRNIERFFKKGYLRYLVCTSTLLHGVNLPARNVFMVDPTKGHDFTSHQDIPISTHDFWNLAGRAGRLGKEFEGNVYLIDYETWKTQVLEKEKERTVVPALQRQLTDSQEDIALFLEDSSLSTGIPLDIEGTVAKLFNDFRKNRIDHTFRLYGQELSPEFKKRLKTGLSNLNTRITLPAELTSRHSGVSALRQQYMYEYICHRIKSAKLDELIPPHPHSSDAYTRSLRLLKRFNTYFEGLPRTDNSHKYYASIGLKWMRGEHLKRILDEAIRRAPTRNPDTVIREVLSNIENRLRFRYVKYVNCYIDLLRYYFQKNNLTYAIERIPPFGLFLELGASTHTMVNFISLGLTRTTSKVLADKAPRTDMERSECIRWLTNFDLDKENLLPLVSREVSEVASSLRANR